MSNCPEAGSPAAGRRSVRKAGIRDPHEHDQREDSEGDAVEEVERLERAQVMGGSDDEARNRRAAAETEVACDSAERDRGGALLATLTRSPLAATTVLAGVAIVIAIAECAQFIVLGPLVAEIAPPHLLGRYMSLYQLSFVAGVALGPAVGGVLLGTSPDTIWWGGAFALALTGAGFLRLGNRIPDPLLPTKSPPLQAASEAT